MIIKEEISKHPDDFKALCKSHQVKYLYAFGSSINDKFDRKNSDIDLLVEIEELDPLERGDKLISLWDKFESFFDRKVDLLTEVSIKNPFLRKVLMQQKY